MADKIKTLIFSGANNHAWKLSTPLVWLLLGRSGRFDATVTVNPSGALENETLVEETGLFFSDYNGPDWSEVAKANLERAIEGGKGLVIMHAADNSFEGWVAYEKMAALLWRKGTGHGAFHEFPVTIVDRKHPITKGLPDFRITDELYHKLVHMHDAQHHVLATGHSSTESGGTGQEEPVMLTTHHGEGRVFHMVLGHIWESDTPDFTALDNAHFQRALLRGCEWAATGRVTLP
jgi:type 1 glutamine amidotransferase